MHCYDYLPVNLLLCDMFSLKLMRGSNLLSFGQIAIDLGFFYLFIGVYKFTQFLADLL